MYNMLS